MQGACDRPVATLANPTRPLVQSCSALPTPLSRTPDLCGETVPCRSLRSNVCLMFLGPVVAVLAMPAAANTAQRVIIIVDGSGSMWGKMEGDETAKLYGVRDLLPRTASRRPLPVPYRLWLIRPPPQGGLLGRRDHRARRSWRRGSRRRSPRSIEPKGKSLTAHGRHPRERESDRCRRCRTDILVHDNADNCSQDICAAAEDIAKRTRT